MFVKIRRRRGCQVIAKNPFSRGIEDRLRETTLIGKKIREFDGTMEYGRVRTRLDKKMHFFRVQNVNTVFGKSKNS